MLQQDESTSLTKTVLSPNTAYTTSSPEVTGMDPTNWEVVLPTSLLNSDLELGEIIDFSSSISVEEPSGKVSIAADAGLPLGTHTLGLKATNASDDEFEFKDPRSFEVFELFAIRLAIVFSDISFSTVSTFPFTIGLKSGEFCISSVVILSIRRFVPKSIVESPFVSTAACCGLG